MPRESCSSAHVRGGQPVVDGQSLGVFVGSPPAPRGDMLRAIIEGLDYQFLDIVLALESTLETCSVSSQWAGPHVTTSGCRTRQMSWDAPSKFLMWKRQRPSARPFSPESVSGCIADEADAYQRASRYRNLRARIRARARRYAEWFPDLPRGLSRHAAVNTGCLRNSRHEWQTEDSHGLATGGDPDCVPTFEWFIDRSVGEALVDSGGIPRHCRPAWIWTALTSARTTARGS